MRLKVPGEKITELHPADLAEILSDLSRFEGSKLLETLDVKTLADTLEEVEPEFQASLIEQMPDERVADVLEEMAPDEAADLLAELPQDRSQELLKLMQADEAETVFYIYCTDQEDHLLGVFSLRQLVLAQPSTPVSEFMEKRVVTVDLQDSQDECAQVISKYNLLAVPVIDGEKRLQGIVTADDALDKIIPTAWKKRLPRMYH